MYSAYKLNKQSDNMQPCHTPFPIWNQSVVPYLILTVAFGLAYRFLRRQVRWSGTPTSLRIFHSLLWSTHNIVNEAEIDVFMELPCFFCDPEKVGNLIPGSSAYLKSSLYIWKFLVQVLLKPSMKDFEHKLTNMWDEHNCMIVWTFFDIAFLWDWNENWPFPVLWPLLSFPNLLTYWVQHFNGIIF